MERNTKSINKTKPASWSSGNTFVSGAGGVRFKSRAGQVGHSVANGSQLLQHFFERSCAAGHNDVEISHANLLHASAYYSEYNKRIDLINKSSSLAAALVLLLVMI